ncbi:MAG: glutamate--cysteine ligase [Myxococcota bacterium]
MSLDQSRSLDLESPVGSATELVEWVRGGEKPASQWRVGTEHEKIGLRDDDLERIGYEGDRGVARILERVAEIDGWAPITESGRIIALEKDGASITLEPGGQFELSGAPLRTVFETCDEFQTHLAVMKEACAPLGVSFIGLGISPVGGVEESPRMPKTRYRIMREYLPTRGELALHMMHLTATVQANLDFSDEADMVEKMRVGMALSPIVSAVFANSSLERGKPSGFVSRRIEIWRHTDPDRCGLLDWVFDEGFGYQRYVEWALDVPMFFILRDERYVATPGLRFRDFLEHGFEGERARLRDFVTHLTTLFPEVRLKRVIELRGADAVPAALTCALPALWKGLLYDAEARQGALALIASSSPDQRQQALVDVARRGLGARLGRFGVLELARELEDIASAGLRRIGHAGPTEADESGFLDPIREQLELGKSPGQVVAERWEGEWARSLPRLIDYARY